MDNPRVTDVRRAFVLHRNRLRRLIEKSFNPYETKELRIEVDDLLEASKALRDRELTDSVLILKRTVERKLALNVMDYQKKGYISKGGISSIIKEPPDTFFKGKGNDRTFCYHMANMPEDQFNSLVKELTEAGKNTYVHLLNRMRPLTAAEKRVLNTVIQKLDDGFSRKDISAELRLSTKTEQRIFAWLPPEYQKEFDRRSKRKKTTKKLVHSQNIANQAIKLMCDGLDLFDLINLDQFTPVNKKAVIAQLNGVVRDIHILTGKESVQ